MSKVLRNLKRKVPYGTAGPLLDMCLKYSILYHCDTYSSMFIVALVTVAREWKHSRCSPVHKWTVKMCCIFSVKFYSSIRTNVIIKFVGTWMDLENVN